MCMFDISMIDCLFAFLLKTTIEPMKVDSIDKKLTPLHCYGFNSHCQCEDLDR